MSHNSQRSLTSKSGNETTKGREVDVPIDEVHQAPRTRRFLSDASQGPGLLDMVAGDEPDDDHEKNKLEAQSSSIIKFYPDWCRCRCCRSVGPISANATIKEQLQSYFQCPPQGTFGRVLLSILLCLWLWAFLFYLLMPLSRPKENGNGKHDYSTNPAWIMGPLFALGIIEITGLLFGILLKRFLNLPPLLGPLILGIVYHNVEEINVFVLMTDYDYRNCGTLPTKITTSANQTTADKVAECLKVADKTVNNWIKPIRIIALGIILTRAGLELSPKQLGKLKGVVPMLAFVPCVVEAMTCGVTSWIFFNLMAEHKKRKMEWAMCFVGGFALAAVSPAVVVPGALSLKKSGYGVVKGVPTLLIAASSIDDVLAISVYTIALGFAIESSSGDEDWKKFSGGALGLGVGAVHGVTLGIIMHFIPPKNSRYKSENRLLLLLLINFTSVLAYEETFFNGAGSISVLVTSFIAGFGWRSQAHWKRPMHKIEKTLAHMWVLWVPLIFGTIGKEIDFKAAPFRAPTIFKIFGVIGISLVIRCITAFLVSGCGTGFNVKERFFIALSWIPKATVQAALAPLVLTRAKEAEAEIMTPNSPQAMKAMYVRQNAEIVVCIAILAVLITAPVGCVLIALTGPKLLQRNSTPEIHMQVEEEFPNGEGIDPTDSTYELVTEVRNSVLKAPEPESKEITMNSSEQFISEQIMGKNPGTPVRLSDESPMSNYARSIAPPSRSQSKK